jgi:hypothetical protein
MNRSMIRGRRWLAAPAMVVAALFVVATAAQAQVRIVTDASADQTLKPGDVLFKLLNDKSQASSVGISLAESAIKALDGKFNSAVARGDAQAIHVAVYIGGGMTAEAHGATSGESAGVSLRHIEHHAGFMFYIFRPRDQRMAAAAAAVARRWATGRMGYKLPFTAIRSSSFGPFARREALRYGKDAGRAGGPKDDGSMFCSQFALAVYQAAVVADELSRDHKLGWTGVRVPYGIDLHASNTSPLNFHGHLIEATQSKHGASWAYMGRILVQTPAPATPPVPATAHLAWAVAPGGRLPVGTFVGGSEPGRSLPICRAAYRGGVHPGKVVAGKCNIGWGGKEIVLTSFQAMVAAPAAFRWVKATGAIPANAVIGGSEPGRRLPICRAAYTRGVHPGKVVAGKCNIGWGGKEVVLTSYEVLVPAQ